MPDFPFHNQECFDYCGAACLMMMLQSQGADLQAMSQFALMQEARKKDVSVGFFCPPESVAGVATARLAPLKPLLIYTIASDNPPVGIPVFTQETMPGVIANCLTLHQLPVFVLSQGGGHWILIYSRGAEGFNWRNPESLGFAGSEDGAAEEDRTHTDSPCALCGSGEMEEALFPAGLKNLPPVDEDYPSYAGQRILVMPTTLQTEEVAVQVDNPEEDLPAQPSEQDQVPQQTENNPDSVPNPKEDSPPLPCGPDQAAPQQTEDNPDSVPNPEEDLPPSPPEQAQAALHMKPQAKSFSPESVRMTPPPESVVTLPDDFLREVTTRLPNFADLFPTHGCRLKDAKVGLGVKVEHLSGNSKLDYLLFPVFLNESAPYFLVQLKADTYELLTMTGITAGKPGKEPWFYYPPEREAELNASLHQKAEQLPAGWKSNRRLVWKFCLESNTPMAPFHEIIRGTETGYMDVFGIIHTKLTVPFPRGKPPGNCENK
jgi:hypothetical protein